MQEMRLRRFPHIPSGGGDAYNVIGERLTFKITSAETGGAFSVMELVGQAGGGPPLHTHASAETFSILEGEFEFSGLENGARYTIRAAPGDTVYIPGGDVHTYRVVSETSGKAVLVFTPGIDMEAFFAEAGTPVTAGMPVSSEPPDIPAMIAVAAKHGMKFVAP